MAGPIPENIVEKIKNDTDILDLISEYVTLKKAGKNYVGLCPFHNEKTPSFTVSPDKGFFHCFGCKESGNAIGFIMRHESLDFPEALRFLAKRAGIAIPEKGSVDSIATKLYQAIEYAQSFYVKHLKNSTAYEYIKSRGINDDVIKELWVGFAPPGWDNLYKEILKDKLSPEVFEKAGLLVKREKQPGYYDKFRNRLMFPIYSLSGRSIGFGGRALNDEEGPKYLNSPETAIYHKGSVLYGLNWSKNSIRQSTKAVIAEGYFDYISLYQAGIKNIVAVSGTGFTANQANMLARFSGEVILLYDADSAGLKATYRAVEVLYNAGLEPKIVRLPEGSDPDSFIVEHGSEKLAMLIDSAKSYLEFVSDSLPDKFVRLSISHQEKLIKSLAETAAGIDDRLKHELFVRKAIEIFDLPLSAEAKFHKRGDVQQSRSKQTERLGRAKFEITYLGLIMSHPEFIDESLKVIKEDNFQDSLNRRIYEKLNIIDINSQPVGGHGFSVGDFLEHFTDKNLRQRLTEIIINETAGAPPEMLFDEYMANFKKFIVADRLGKLRIKLANAEKEGKIEESEKIYREFQDLQNTANQERI